MEILKSFFLVIFHLLRILVESLRILAGVLLAGEPEKPDSGGPYFNLSTGEYDSVKVPGCIYDDEPNGH